MNVFILAAIFFTNFSANAMMMEEEGLEPEIQGTHPPAGPKDGQKTTETAPVNTFEDTMKDGDKFPSGKAGKKEQKCSIL